MSEVVRKYATDETFREVANLLFGDDQNELVSKISAEQKKRERTQARVGLASNIVGIGAGVAGTREAMKEPRLRGKVGSVHKPEAIRITRGGKYAAGGLLGLQIGNLAGDAVANRVLARSAKDPKKKVSKMNPVGSDLSSPGALKRGALKRINETPQINATKVAVGRKAKDKLGKSVTWEGEISKVDEDKRQVFGWASIVEVNGEPVADLQGDIIGLEEIEKSAYDYVIKSRKGGDMHRRNHDDTPVHSSDMIESFLVTPEKIAKMGLPEGSLPIGWWVGYQVNDDDAWNLVKSGKRTAFSIHGRGHRTPVED